MVLLSLLQKRVPKEKKSLVVLALEFLAGEATYARTQETLVSEKGAQGLILTDLQESGNDACHKMLENTCLLCRLRSWSWAAMTTC
jgi:hypothetical protein